MKIPSEQPEEALFDLTSLFSILFEKRWWLIGFMITGILLAAIASYLIAPVYRSAVVVVSSTDRNPDALGAALGGLGGVASMVGISVGGKSADTEEALAVLRSRGFTERFIVDKQLMPKLFANKWDAEKAQWKERPKNRPTTARAYKYFNSKIRQITQDKKTGLITVEIQWKDRTEAAEWANELVERLNQEMRGRAIRKADASLVFLEKEYQQVSTVATREAISRLIEAQVKQRMLANVTEEYSFRVVDKALPADVDDPLRPQKFKMIMWGGFLGLMLGGGVALISNVLRKV